MAIILFDMGGSLSIYEGVEHPLHSQSPEHPTWNYAVLGIAEALQRGGAAAEV